MNSSLVRGSWRLPVISLVLIIAVGCNPNSDAAKRQDRAEFDDESVGSPSVPTLPVPFYPDGRLFVCRYGTGLDPAGQVDLPNHVQSLPEIHRRYVDEFTRRPGFGMERYHWEPSQWVELIGHDSSNSSLVPNVTQLYPAHPSQPKAGQEGRIFSHRPIYDWKADALTSTDRILNGVDERLWILQEMHLVGLVKALRTPLLTVKKQTKPREFSTE